MSTITVNISFQEKLLDEIDAEANRESRSRSDLLREAARLYINRQRRWERLFQIGDSKVEEYGITQKEVQHEINMYREETGKQQ